MAAHRSLFFEWFSQVELNCCPEVKETFGYNFSIVVALDKFA